MKHFSPHYGVLRSFGFQYLHLFHRAGATFELLPQLRAVLCASTAKEATVDPKKGGRHYLLKEKKTSHRLEAGLLLKIEKQKKSVAGVTIRKLVNPVFGFLS